VAVQLINYIRIAFYMKLQMMLYS